MISEFFFYNFGNLNQIALMLAIYNLLYDNYITLLDWSPSNLLVFLNSSYICFCRNSIALLVLIITLTRTGILFVLLSNGLVRVSWLPTSTISKIGGRRLLSLNVSFEILVPQKPISLSTLTINLLYERSCLSNSLTLGINCLFNNFFPII